MFTKKNLRELCILFIMIVVVAISSLPQATTAKGADRASSSTAAITSTGGAQQTQFNKLTLTTAGGTVERVWKILEVQTIDTKYWVSILPGGQRLYVSPGNNKTLICEPWDDSKDKEI